MADDNNALQSMIKDYIDELDICIQQISNCLLDFEQSNPSNDMIDDVLRNLHSMKGASQMMGLENSSIIFHKLEDLISLIDQKKIDCDEMITTTIFDSLDEVKKISTKIEKSGLIEDGNPFNIIDMLTLYVDVARGGGAIQPKEVLVPGELEKAQVTEAELAMASARGESKEPQAQAETGVAAEEFKEASASECVETFDPKSYADPETLSSFISNTKIIIDELGNDFVCLEKNPEDKELLDKIFRAMHTIKGNSFMIPIMSMGNLAHEMENIFDNLRKNIYPIDPAMMDVMLEGLDHLEQIIQNLEQNNQIDVDMTHIVRTLARIDVLGKEGKTLESTGKEPPSAEKQKAVPVAKPEVPVTEPVKNTAEAPKQEQPKKVESDSSSDASDKPELKRAIRTLRVDINKIDNNMNLLTELIINKIRFEERFYDHLSVQETMFKTSKRIIEMNQMDDDPVKFEVLLQKINDRFLEFRRNRDGVTLEKDIMYILQKHSRYLQRLNIEGFYKEIDLIGKELKQQITKSVEGTSYLTKTVKSISNITNDLQESLLKIRMLPISTLFSKFPRMVRDLKRKLNKDIALVVKGEDTELDKTIIEEISDSLMHIVRNCADHGIENPEERTSSGKSATGTITLDAYYEGNQVVLEIADDGKGMSPDMIRQKAVERGLITEDKVGLISDREAISFVFAPGFSTVSEVSDLSGRGVGMDVVKTQIKKLKGTVDLDSKPGKGTVFKIRLPLTLRILQALLIKTSNEIFAMPLSFVIKTLVLSKEDIRKSVKHNVINYFGKAVPVVSLSAILNLKRSQDRENDLFNIVIVQYESRYFAILIDEIVERKEIVIKNFGDYINNIRHITGATILGNGRIVLILDIPEILSTFLSSNNLSIGFNQRKTVSASEQVPNKHVQEIATKSDSVNTAKPRPAAGSTKNSKVLIVEDSSLVRRLISNALKLAGYQTEEAVDGVDALEKVKNEHFDLLTVDVMMPRMNGYEFTSKLRSLPEYNRTPVIMVSSNNTKIDKQKGMEAGADEYITKPFIEKDLIKTIMKRLG